ncbi:Rpn family recombination-promoting nuclease/putative transposase [Oxynema sp. CENA135]|uniref:Rpn family recombination-promoting nuclease/putative transposase n=1 Tax=Oxynema sp. CENA135 TaxID=984206 RepID=UPI001909DB6F|nr:Rpn family recombination-promoting nuclease/putative transposase [Oxynema sp. CENA135]MBK4732945.1 Rpn family recombination-promoting nuclease/putative transposase [Oxynema sp. CENA135]
MKTDSIFYRLFQIFPDVIFDAIGRPPAEADRYEFQSVELKQLAFRLDGLFVPKSPQRGEPIYFVEVQFYREEGFYFRFFGQIFLYLSQYKPIGNPWSALVIYPTRQFEVEQHLQYGPLLESDRVTRVYLDEWGEETETSLGVEIVKLIVTSEEETPEKARQSIARTQEEITEATHRRDVLELIETIVIYKLPKLSREEIGKMLGLGSLKQTKVYQEAKEEGLQEGLQQLQEKIFKIALKMRERGYSVEEIAELLELSVEEVRETLEI